jgi:hypothetical protein
MSLCSRLLVLALLTTAAASSGCRSMAAGRVATEPLAPVPELGVAQIVEDHNRNAQLVRSLEASPSVSVRGKAGGGASGRMALVRPRDFRLTLETTLGRSVADLGSNGEEFWVWSANSQDKQFFVGRYDDTGLVAPDLMFQPEWIVEALGLRMIAPDEARRLTAEKGDSAGTLTLVHHRTDSRGTPLLKKTVVDRQTGQVQQHEFYAADGRTVLARAFPSDYRPTAVPAGESPAEAAPGGTSQTVLLPGRIRLVATPPGAEEVTMEISIGSAKVNQFPDTRRAKLFTIPNFEEQGYARVDLESLAPQATIVRETRPAPPSGARVRLEQPIELDNATKPAATVIEGASRGGPVATDPRPLAADLPAPSLEPIPAGPMTRIVGARLPTAPGTVDLPPDLDERQGVAEFGPRRGASLR